MTIESLPCGYRFTSYASRVDEILRARNLRIARTVGFTDNERAWFARPVSGS